MPFVKCYCLNGNKPSGCNTRAMSKTMLKAMPVFITLANLVNKDTIMKNCGKLKGSGKSITFDLPCELACCRKELLSSGYNLCTSSDTSTRVAGKWKAGCPCLGWENVIKNDKMEMGTSREDVKKEAFYTKITFMCLSAQRAKRGGVVP